ncbi:MAG TPA: type I-U CRISPR-associated protein Csx17 [Solirubrobacteraceae bacterium]|jgi:CRISPR-associated endonuclease/helicase Cas3|nr:type I-U CRISPR-associated protein Csx17 [Solirubrobacteraceae bacterium]
MSDRSFVDFFRAATGGDEPYRYQCVLGERAEPPAVIAVPTGSGKTRALIISWLYGRQVRKSGPRRLVYALPMRSLVEQTADEASRIRERLGLAEDELGIHILMGGVEPRDLRDWRNHPGRDQILIGTVDMLLSRALNRGYAEGRFQWPVAFGLLNSDCRWVFDEVQLMGVACITAAQLDGLRAQLGVALPCETIWVSATVDKTALRTVDRPELGEELGLSPEDAAGLLAKRLDANKRLQRIDLSQIATRELPRAIAQAVVEHHRPATRSIVVLNKVDLAQQVLRALDHLPGNDGMRPELVLLHSRFRPQDRKRHMDDALGQVPTDGPGRIVVSTQVIEAGVDTSCALLVTETAPFSSIVQRIGRCNREGEVKDGALVLWLDRGELDTKPAAPYDPADLAIARDALLPLVGQSVSPNLLNQIEVRTRSEASATLRRRDLIDLFDTAPDLSGMDVDVSRFIREDDERSISVFFRDVGDDRNATAVQPAAERDELVQVPIDSFEDRRAWVYDHVEGRWVTARGSAIRPGATVMLCAAEGGYDERLGWLPTAREAVSVPELIYKQPAESIYSYQDSLNQKWVTLREHLDDTAMQARELLAGIGDLNAPIGATVSVHTAAALHDVGKAHPAFQAMLRSTATSDERPENLETTLWAKSANGGGRHQRRHFRHELASVLATRTEAYATATGAAAADQLAQYLIAAHHGRIRMSIRPAPEERSPEEADGQRFALGVLEGDRIHELETPLGKLPEVTLDLSPMDLGGDEPSWTELACQLRDHTMLGPFRLAYLEALVRIADWLASAQPRTAATPTHTPDTPLPASPAVVSSTRSTNQAPDTLKLAGCRAGTLIGYLKALGVLRVLARQVDPTARGRWSGETFELLSSLNRDALAEFLLERYIPVPVVSPWNGGSGFFPKDNTRAMRAIEDADDHRFDPLRHAISQSRAILTSLELVEKPSERATKLRLLRELRARLDDDALEWLDAAVALRGNRVDYPPLLGSGGNDGRFDFANNYAQALVVALSLSGTEKARARARGLLDAALDRAPAQLEKMSTGHFLRDSSPVNSPTGESDGLGNPWDLVLALEGSLLLTPGTARRHGVVADTTMVAPFTVRATAAGYGSAIGGESGRAELWLPLWNSWTGLPELEAMTREARAQVGRRNARSGLDFARASGEMAVARGIAAFARFALLERAGQSTLAVPAGRIEVSPRPQIAAIRTLDRYNWLGRVQAYARADAGRAPAHAIARLERELFAFAERGDRSAACAVLERLGEVESLLAAGAAGEAPDGPSPLREVPALPWLHAADDGSVEFAIATSLASLHDYAATAALPALRDYLHGTNIDEQGTRSYSGHFKRTAPRRTDPIERLALLHRRRQLDVERLGSSGRGSDRPSRQLSFTRGICCPLRIAHRFALGDHSLDDARILRLTAGLALLDFRSATQWRPQVDLEDRPAPAFDALALAWAGTGRHDTGSTGDVDPEEPHRQAGGGMPSEEVDHIAARTATRHRGPPGELQPRIHWVPLLTADRAEPVLQDALLRLRMAKLPPLVTAADLMQGLRANGSGRNAGRRLAAALQLRLRSGELRGIEKRLIAQEEPTLKEGATQ